jgi:hypothetical protein
MLATDVYANMGNGFDLYPCRRLGQRRNLHQRARGKIARKDLAACPPNIVALRDIGSVAVNLIGVRVARAGSSVRLALLTNRDSWRYGFRQRHKVGLWLRAPR